MFDISQWSTVIIFPSFWWRLRVLFMRKPEIIFMWGQDKFRIVGLNGQDSFRCGGVPTKYRIEFERTT